MAQGFGRFLKPSSWPINGKLAFAFVITALIPILLTAFFGYRDTLSNVRQNRLRELQQLAVVTAGRVDQLVTQSARIVKTLQRNTDARLALAGNGGALTRADALMLDLLSANEDLQEILLVDRRGVVVASTAPPRRNLKLGELPAALRPSGPRGIAVGHVALGQEAPALWLTAPVQQGDGAPAGNVLVKVVANALDGMLVVSTLRGRAVPFIVNDLGIIIRHPDAKLERASLGTLPAADIAAMNAEGRQDTSANIRSPGAEALAIRLRTSKVAGHLEHAPLFSAAEEATGFAPVLSLPWMVGVTEPRQRWALPLREVYASVIVKVLLLAVLAALAGVLIFARDLVQPIRRLIVSAQAVKSGDYANARAQSINEDEIGELTATFNTMVDSIEKRDHERDLFGRMVSPEVREKLLGGQLKLGGENRPVAVLFSDIRDFTTLCEGMSAEKVVEMLNEYLTEMTTAVKPWYGYVNNFMGDAVMVVFGAPYEHPDCAWGAVQAAFDMRARLDDLNRRRQARGEAPIGHGIGIASGTVVAGQMGSIDRFQYTVIGDAVNVASRLEGLTKEYAGNPILVTGDIVADIRFQDDVVITKVDERQLKGRSQATEIYAVQRRA